MRYLPEGTLAGPAQPLERSAGLAAVADAARGLADLHVARLVHGAVKPSNVLLVAGAGQLADPALAQLFTPGVTLTGLGAATAVEYSDPDLLRGDPPKPAHDVWSLGLLIHWVATGTGVYGELPAGDGLLALRQLTATQPALSPTLPAALYDLVRECLAPAAARPSAAEVADRVTAALG
jgi:serine/threonine protein kinase